MSIPAKWMPPAKMSRIHVHWTGGQYRANPKDRESYHILIEGNGNLVRGDRPIDANQKGSGKKPAHHTLHANTGAIGVSICCMGGKGVTENPFAPGKFPLTQAQWETMTEVVSELSQRYQIPVTSKTILTHAEVEPNLKIKQRQKWDISRLAFDPTAVGAHVVGDRLRREVAAALDAAPGEAAFEPPDSMRLSKFRVSGVNPSTLTFRDAPRGAKKGRLGEGTVVEKLSEDGDWWQVRTPAGFVGWVAAEFLERNLNAHRTASKTADRDPGLLGQPPRHR